MMLEEDAMLIPYQIGDVFVSHTQEETQEMLEAAKVSFHNHVEIAFKKTNKQKTKITSSKYANIILMTSVGYCRH